MTVDKTDKTKQTTPDLDTHEGCWTSVSQRLSLKDELSMKAYSEDIDSLLTLDGLFSAVVTGFIALAVPMLQADSGQTSTQLLYTISTQLNSLVLTPPFINSTATVQPAQPFQATATARWINSLWFISLVFSLASAVMGILAKQWIREYLQWKSPSASARESVFLRELRSESWNIWHVSALISAVPILLEIAILLFTCGLAAYVRTLDLVVGVIVIVSVALFLLLVAALTILPSACRHCPYKSPTAWALLCLLRWFIGLHDRARSLFQWNASPDPSPSDEGPIISQYNMHFETIHSAAYLHSGTPPSWRTRDLEGAHINQLKHSTSNLGDQDLALHKELEFELRDAVEFIGVDLSNDLRVSSAALRVYRATVVEADLLFKVLVKLVMETPSHSTLQIVAQCTQAMLTSLSCTSTPEYTGISSDVHLAELALDGAFHNISVWCMLSRLDSAGPGYMGPLAQPVPPSRVIDQHTLVTSVLQAIRLFILGEQPLRTTLGCAFLPLDDKNNNRTAEYKESPFHYSQYIVMNYVLAYRLQDIVSQILHRSILDLGPSHSVPQLLHRRADEMLYTLRLVTFYWDSSSQLSRSCLWDCAQVLADVFNTISVSQYKARVDLVFPGLRTELFLVLSMSQYSISCTSQLILELGPPLEEPSNRAQSNLALVTKLSDTYLDDLSEEETTILSHAVNFALSEVEHLTPTEIDVLCNRMISIMEEVKSEHPTDRRLHSLHETWTDQLASSADLGRDEPTIITVILARSPDSLLHLLRALRVDLSDRNAPLARQLVQLLRIIHLPLSDGPRSPTPESDSASGWQTGFEPALQECTRLLAVWRMDLFPRVEGWHGLFVWTAGHWFGEISRSATTTRRDKSTAAKSSSRILCAMIAAIKAAVQNQWQESLLAIVALWPDGLFSVPSRPADGDRLHAEVKDLEVTPHTNSTESIFPSTVVELQDLVRTLIHAIHILGIQHPRLPELRALGASLRASDTGIGGPPFSPACGVSRAVTICGLTTDRAV